MESNAASAANGVAEFKEVRGLMPGPLGWNKNGATLSPVSKSGLGNDTPDARSVMLMVDQRLAMHFGSRSKTKSVVAAEIAAFIAWRALAQDARIGAMVFNDRKIDLLWPNCTRLSVMLILHAVLNHNHALAHNGKCAFNSEMLNRVLRRIEQVAADDYAIYLITDASGYNEETRRLLASISQRSHLRLVLIFDPRQKKFSKTRWLLSKRFLYRSKGRGSQDEAWLSLAPGSRSQIFSEGCWPGKIPVIRFSTWESSVEQLRRASRKSILPPQNRPPQSKRDRRNGNGRSQNGLITEAKNGMIPMDVAASTTTQRYKRRGL
jgi:hypothetical protein